MTKLPDQCKAEAEAGEFIPVIDRNKCEGKAACVTVCPYSVFAIQKLTKNEFSSLNLRGKLKALAHGRNQAFVVQPDACQACSLCVAACPEGAIHLERNHRH